MDKLPLNDQFLVLCLDKRKIAFSSLYHSINLSVGLSGALLFELLLLKRIIPTENQDFVEDTNVVLSSIWVEKLLKKIETKNLFKSVIGGKTKEKTLGNWLKVFKSQAHYIKENTLKDLKQQEIIGEEPAMFLGVTLFNYDYLKASELRQILKEKLRKIIEEKNTDDLKALMLLRIIKGSKTLKYIFHEKGKDELKNIEEQLDTLLGREEIVMLLSKIIGENKQKDSDDLLDAIEAIAEAIDSIGDAMDAGSDGGGSDGGGDGGGGD